MFLSVKALVLTMVSTKDLTKLGSKDNKVLELLELLVIKQPVAVVNEEAVLLLPKCLKKEPVLLVSKLKEPTRKNLSLVCASVSLF